MKKPFWGMALGIALCAAMAGASAAGQGTLYVDNILMENGSYLPSGASAPIAGKPAAGQQGYAWYQDGVLTLNRFQGREIDADDVDLTIRLVGDTVLINAEQGTLMVNDGDLTIEGKDGSLTLTATGKNNEALDIDTGDLTIRGGVYAFTTLDDGIEAEKCNVTIENAKLTILNHGTDSEEGIDVENRSDLVIRSSEIVIHVPHDAINADDGSVLIENSTLQLTSRESDGIFCAEDLIIRGSRLNISAENRALSTTGSAALAANEMQLLSRSGHLAISAEGGLNAPELPVVENVLDEITGSRVFSIGDANGPFSRFVCPVHTERKPPSTGDDTPVALLAAMAALSVSVLLAARRRFLNARG